MQARHVLFCAWAGACGISPTWAMTGTDAGARLASADVELASGEVARRREAAISTRMPEAAATAWARFAADGAWRATWDGITGVPSRIVGPGIPAPGSVASAEAAEAHARALLAAHIDLLAPGASPDDFAVVSNDLDGDMRTVGMRQHHGGLRVIGGQVSFRFKNDRLFVIASEALPHVRLTVPKSRGAARVSAAVASAAAVGWIQGDLATAPGPGPGWLGAGSAGSGALQATSVEGPFILPIVSADGALAYHEVMEVVVDSQGPHGAWTVHVAATGGAPVARQQRARFATATARIRAPVRYPGGGRAAYPASFLHGDAGGQALAADGGGVLAWPGVDPVDIVLESSSLEVDVADRWGARASKRFSAEPGTSILWAAAEDDADAEAYLATLVHAGLARDYARRFAPDLEFLARPLRATVNLDSTCNAYSDGVTINFFRASELCDNTGRLADVIYHEFGHVLHRQSIIEGTGNFDPALSEGMADYLAATMLDDPGMGRGFFYDDEPVRHIDPDDEEHAWPGDIGEIHYTGLIFAGAMWDLRERLIARHGYEQGVAHADRLYYAAVRRAANIPATYVEILAADDDDGDLENGTPNACDINEAFAAHGLRRVDIAIDGPTSAAPSPDGHPISITIAPLTGTCPGDRVREARIAWVRGDQSASGRLELTGAGQRFDGRFPAQPAGTLVRYRVELELDDGTVQVLPGNPTEAHFSYYVGDMIPLYCTDFEADPFAGDWSSGPTGPWTLSDADDWQWGTPAFSSGGDPGYAFSGGRVLGNDLTGRDDRDGNYEASRVNYAITPRVYVGRYSDVRLQYRRWLNIEDARFDRASIYAGGRLAWRNAGTDEDSDAPVDHRDEQWVFHDVPLSHLLDGDTVEVKFEIQSDRGFELGGWTIDDVCIVARAGSICGDGVVSSAEECDHGDANSDEEPGACRSYCRLAACGDGVVDSGEQCDDGNRFDDDECRNTCVRAVVPGSETGCAISGAGGGGHGAGALALLGLGLLILARRRSGTAARAIATAERPRAE